jgi:two-component system, NarL family, response regulator DesR
MIGSGSDRRRELIAMKVLIADDDRKVGASLQQILNKMGYSVAAVAEDGQRAIEMCRRTLPDVAILDIEMPGLDGLAVAEALTSELPDTRALILTTFGRPGYLRRAIDAGAAGFLLKDAPATQLADAIREVHAGGRVIDPALAAAAIADGVSPLTERGRDVLVAARDDATAAQIAARLYLSEGTVRNYLSAAIRKLDARNRADALRIAEDKGWL